MIGSLLRVAVPAVVKGRIFFGKKILCLSLEPRTNERHLVERHDFERHCHVTRALVYMMRDFQLSVIGIVYVCSVFTSAVTESFSRLTDVRTLTVAANEEVHHVLCLAAHLLLNMENLAVLHFDWSTLNKIRAVAAERVTALFGSLWFLF